MVLSEIGARLLESDGFLIGFFVAAVTLGPLGIAFGYYAGREHQRRAMREDYRLLHDRGDAPVDMELIVRHREEGR
jgi:hypothetical protein